MSIISDSCSCWKQLYVTSVREQQICILEMTKLNHKLHYNKLYGGKVC